MWNVMILNNATKAFKILTFGEFDISLMRSLIEDVTIKDIIEKKMRNYDRDYPYTNEILTTDFHTYYVQSE